ncbi:MAG: hypothetical protein ABI432_00925 [Flavobacteriales bacterium]
MHALKTTAILLSLFFYTSTSVAAPASKDPHHVMWTSAKGKDKCCNKGSKVKADHCAEKMRAKGKAKNVQVMAGKCKSM